MKIGDVVYLNSGGPALVVVDIDESDEAAGVRVAWMDALAAYTTSFPKICLRTDNPQVGTL